MPPPTSTGRRGLAWTLVLLALIAALVLFFIRDITQPEPLTTETAQASAPTPFPLVTRPVKSTLPTPQVAASVQPTPLPGIDCQRFPGLPGCSSSTPAVSGRLAFIDAVYGLTLLNLEDGKTWSPSIGASRIVGWSPSGFYLLVQKGDADYAILRDDGEELLQLNALPQAPFWAPVGAFPGVQDWLAVVNPDGSLQAQPVPQGEPVDLLPPASLGAKGQNMVRWSPDQWLNWSPSLVELEAGGGPTQTLYARSLASPAETLTSDISQDYQAVYYALINKVPSVRLALTAKGTACKACWADGAALATINLDSGLGLDVQAAMLLSEEAYAWNPRQPGLMALAEGSGRFIFENKHLALFNVPAGELSTITPAEWAAFEPNWSPDGSRLAFSAQRATPGASGSSEQLERTLIGRAVVIYDLVGKGNIYLTQPPPGTFDGWPRWMGDGRSLLYARQVVDGSGGAEKNVEIRALNLDTQDEGRLFSVALNLPLCHSGGCEWGQVLAYTPGMKIEQAVSPVLEPTPSLTIEPDPSQKGFNLYTNPGYGFSFHYPSTWKLEDQPNFVHLSQGTYMLTIGFRRLRENTQIGHTASGAGELEGRGSIPFLGQEISRRARVYQGKDKAVLYNNGDEIASHGLAFTLALEDTTNSDYASVAIPVEIGAQADEVVRSFETPGEWDANYIPTIPAAAFGQLSKEEIARNLFDLWLNHFRSWKADPRSRLDDYTLVEVGLDDNTPDRSQEQGAEFVARITFSVKPTGQVSTWAAGNGIVTEDGWVRSKQLIVGVIKEGEHYKLKIIGSGT